MHKHTLDNSTSEGGWRSKPHLWSGLFSTHKVPLGATLKGRSSGNFSGKWRVTHFIIGCCAVEQMSGRNTISHFPYNLRPRLFLFIFLSLCRKASCLKLSDIVLILQILPGLESVDTLQSGCKSQSFTLCLAFLSILRGRDQLPFTHHFIDFLHYPVCCWIEHKARRMYEAMAGTRAPLAFQLRDLQATMKGHH